MGKKKIILLLVISKSGLIKFVNRVKIWSITQKKSLGGSKLPIIFFALPIVNPVLNSVRGLIKMPFASVTAGLELFKTIKHIILGKIDIDSFYMAYDHVRIFEEQIRELRNLGKLNVGELKAIFLELEKALS
jgi:hypothetical protein